MTDQELIHKTTEAQVRLEELRLARQKAKNVSMEKLLKALTPLKFILVPALFASILSTFILGGSIMLYRVSNTVYPHTDFSSCVILFTLLTVVLCIIYALSQPD